jgi:hypothetical protein
MTGLDDQLRRAIEQEIDPDRPVKVDRLPESGKVVVLHPEDEWRARTVCLSLGAGRHPYMTSIYVQRGMSLFVDCDEARQWLEAPL